MLLRKKNKQGLLLKLFSGNTFVIVLSSKFAVLNNVSQNCCQPATRLIVSDKK